MLKLNIKATNIEMDDALYEYVYDKIGNLDKYIKDIDGSVQTWVEIGKPSKHHCKGEKVFYAEVDIRLSGQGRVLRAESRQPDLRLAINEVKDELQRELKRYKGRQEAKYKRGARKAKNLIRLSPLAWFKRKRGGREKNE